MEADPSKAIEMFDAFESVGASLFDVRVTGIEGKMLEKGGFFRSCSGSDLPRTIGARLKEPFADELGSGRASSVPTRRSAGLSIRGW